MKGGAVIIIAVVLVLAYIVGADMSLVDDGNEIEAACTPTDMYAQGNKGRPIRIYDCGNMR